MQLFVTMLRGHKFSFLSLFLLHLISLSLSLSLSYRPWKPLQSDTSSLSAELCEGGRRGEVRPIIEEHIWPWEWSLVTHNKQITRQMVHRLTRHQQASEGKTKDEEGEEATPMTLVTQHILINYSL